jgi:hypothetical protein
MMQSRGPSKRPERPRSVSPAERSAEYAEAQQRMKREAAERRSAAAERSDAPKPTSTRRGRA